MLSSPSKAECRGLSSIFRHTKKHHIQSSSSLSFLQNGFEWGNIYVRGYSKTVNAYFWAAATFSSFVNELCLKLTMRRHTCVQQRRRGGSYVIIPIRLAPDCGWWWTHQKLIATTRNVCICLGRCDCVSLEFIGWAAYTKNNKKCGWLVG